MLSSVVPVGAAWSAARVRSQSASRLSSMAALYEGVPAAPSAANPPTRLAQLATGSSRSRVGMPNLPRTIQRVRHGLPEAVAGPARKGLEYMVPTRLRACACR